jgi:hypothetical protein
MSDFPQSPQDPYVSPQVVEKQGMSSGAKLLLALGIIFLVCVLVCCGGGGILAYLVSQDVKGKISDDPVVIAKQRSEILDVEIPESFEPAISVDGTVPLVGTHLMTLVVYAGESPDDSLVFVEVGEMLSSMPQQEMDQQIEDSLRQQGVGQPTPGTEWDTTEKEFEIDGRPTKFIYRTAKNEDGDPTRFHVTGTVDGNRGPVVVIISANAETFSEEQIDQVIETINK